MDTIRFPDNRFSAYLQYQVVTNVTAFQPHYHSGFELLYMIEGKNFFYIHDKQWQASAGDLVIYHPGVVHKEYQQLGPYRIFCLRFNDTDLPIPIPFPGPSELQPVFHLPWEDQFRVLFEQMISEKAKEDRWNQTMVGTYLTQFIVLLWRALSQCKKTPQYGTKEHTNRINYIIQLIDANIQRDISLHYLAEKAYMSESHFSHTFKDIVGIPPKQYLIQKRLQQAKDLLTSTNKPIAHIADILGYTSPQYFARFFKKHMGLTPSEFRTGLSSSDHQ